MNRHQEFLTMYQPIHESFVRYCSSRAYGLMESEDLVQETILATMKNFSKLKTKEKLLSYMIGTANNMLKNKLRRKKFKGHFDELAFAKLESKEICPEVAMDIHYLYKALQELPDKQKEALILFAISGFSIKEISQLQKSSTAATKTRISRARKRLKTLLIDDDETVSMKAKLSMYATILL